MRKKTPEMPNDMFDENSAIAKLTGGGGPHLQSTIPQPQMQEALTLESKKATQNRLHKQTSIYFSPEQLVKLDDLAYAHFKRTGERINRNDIVRHLVDRCQLNDIADLVQQAGREQAHR